MPDYRIERQHGAPRHSIVGIDEAGRGALAGPVTAAAVVFPAGTWPDGLDDSKKLRPNQREHLARMIRATAHVAVSHVDVPTIDRLNILHAALLAMTQACRALVPIPHHALIDGNRCPGGLPCPASTIIGGDRNSVSIAAASIIAKVERDRIMSTLDRQFPDYGWAQNKGYGTRDHQAALRRVGRTRHHRTSFAPVRAAPAENCAEKSHKA